ncbi:MAG TPA: Asp23/Gls24 family envelope stress response protein [Gaiellaceae bacterium]|nr:Asp23/Gls24 family envelope stress response protein [Gaiellaceae bacterium]
MTYVLHEKAGAITVADAAMTQIVVQAVESVDGARIRRPRRKLELAIDGRRAHVELELAVVYGKVLPDVARDVQEQVTEALTRMCGLDVAAVDVTVEELDR